MLIKPYRVMVIRQPAEKHLHEVYVASWLCRSFGGTLRMTSFLVGWLIHGKSALYRIHGAFDVVATFVDDMGVDHGGLEVFVA